MPTDQSIKMATVANLDFVKQLPFLRYWTNPCHIWQKCCDSDLEHMYNVDKNAQGPEFKMAAAAIWD